MSDNTYRLSNGTTFYASRLILGLAPDDDALFYGYDGEVWINGDMDRDFTPEERAEIATFMVNRWKKWGGL